MAKQTDQLNYKIKVKGELDPVWMEWFEGLTLTHDCEGNTVFAGTIVDYTALHSILLKIRDLNLKLISVNEIELNDDDIENKESEVEVTQ